MCGGGWNYRDLGMQGVYGVWGSMGYGGLRVKGSGVSGAVGSKGCGCNIVIFILRQNSFRSSGSQIKWF